MKQQTSPAIVLSRTNYGEADRIVTFLTPVGKIKAIVKGVRRSKSKLAGGIELFSESTVTFLETRGDLSRVISSQLVIHWDGIVGDLQRMMYAYEAMKIINRVVEDEAEQDYYTLLKSTLQALSDSEIPLSGIEMWFYIRILSLTGHKPNLKTDASGKALQEDQLYVFVSEEMCFKVHTTGDFRAEHIKLLRLALHHQPGFLKQIQQSSQLSDKLAGLLKQCLATILR